MLNKDQQKGLEEIRKWWLSGESYMRIEGIAGTGKTYMTWEAVKNLPGCTPLLTAPTNAAVKQLGKTIPKEDTVELKTTYSALNVSFDSSKEKQELVRKKAPEFSNINLIVVEEASFIGNKKHIRINENTRVSLEDLLADAVKQDQQKILYIGHRSQLPEVLEGDELTSIDRCESTIFTRNYREFKLTTPMRAKGALQEAHDYLESLIYQKLPRLENNWKISEKEILNYIQSSNGKLELFEGSSNILAYTNACIDSWNSQIREVLFSNRQELPFLRNDRILLTRPTIEIGRISSKDKESSLLKKEKSQLDSNSLAKILHVSEVDVLGLPCWELFVSLEDKELFLYVPKDEKDFEEFKDRKRKAVYASKEGAKGWLKYHNILALFSFVKHTYALTAHRAQGTTIEKVFVDWDNIRKCQNQWLRQKLLYVAGSRSSNEMYIKG